jgi:hypothetical protein
MKGFTMALLTDDQMLFRRRDFLLAVFLSPLLAKSLLTDEGIDKIGSLFTDAESEFVILGGWVLRKNDLIGDQD